MITDACSEGKASVCTTTAGRGLPWSLDAATVKTSPRRIVIEFGEARDRKAIARPVLQMLELARISQISVSREKTQIICSISQLLVLSQSGARNERFQNAW